MTASGGQDLYDVLGVHPEAPDEVIRAAYRALAAKYHPDRNPGDPAADVRLKALNEAFETLGDPVKRRRYDEVAREARARKTERGARATQTDRETHDSSRPPSTTPGTRTSRPTEPAPPSKLARFGVACAAVGLVGAIDVARAGFRLPWPRGPLEGPVAAANAPLDPDETGQVPLLSPEGDRFHADPSAVRSALAQGYRPLSPQERLDAQIAREERKRGVPASVTQALDAAFDQVLLGGLRVLEDRAGVREDATRREAVARAHLAARAAGAALGMLALSRIAYWAAGRLRVVPSLLALVLWAAVVYWLRGPGVTFP